MNKRVCALVVTFNRKECLLRLITDGLISQSYPIEKILVFDNFSSDGTADLLKEKGIIKEVSEGELTISYYCGVEFLYYRNTSNEGGSGGFHEGIKIASEQGCELIWTMDDDVLPDKDCLRLLVRKIGIESRVCIPNRTDEYFDDFAITKINMSNPFRYNLKLRQTKIKGSEIVQDAVVVKDMAFEGPLFDVSVIKEIGLPKKELFILFDDTEYAYRASCVTNILFIKDAILHKQIIPEKDTKKIMGWKSYYSIRNQYWYDRTYGTNIFVKVIRPRLNSLDLSIRAIIKQKWGNFRVLRKAYRDGMQGRLGKIIDPDDKLKFSNNMSREK